MKLQVKFDKLWDAVRRISDNRDELSVDIKSTWEEPEYQRIATELKRGKEVTLDEIDVNGKLLNYKGQHVLLYIADHGRDIENVVRGRRDGRRFHVADCCTLVSMREKGRYARYVATTNISGLFHIIGVSEYDATKALEADVPLQVCQNCLKALNYKNANNVKTFKLAKEFNIEEFFETYSSFFSVVPNVQEVQKETATYTRDWPEISKRIRENAHWCCESCHVDLHDHKELLHTHHLNGVKNDNRDSNLISLCIGCHRLEPNHGRIHLNHSDTILLNQLRREQNLFRNLRWEDAIRFADPALHGVLQLCKKYGWTVPEVEFSMAGKRFEVAWPTELKAIDLKAKETYIFKNWKIYTIADLLDELMLRLKSGYCSRGASYRKRKW